jgi:acyl transferase domain-containing protein/acyl carrier protein
MVLAMRHGELPKTLHAGTPSSHVDWSAGAAELLTERVTWPETGRPRRAAISSFGASGTNAHLIVEQPPAEPAVDAPGGTAVLPVVVSGRTPAAVEARLRDLAAYLRSNPGVSLRDVAFSTAGTRAAFEHRAAVVAGDRDALPDALESRSVLRDEVAGGKLAFLFTGQGSQLPGMGRDLYERFGVFASAFDAVLAGLDPEVRAVMWGSDAGALARTGVAQPALFAVEVALFRLFESWGVCPDFLAGHSVGEIAAAHVAGVLSLADACTLVSARARLMQALPSGGAMVSLRASEDEVAPLLTPGVSIAAVNGPSSVVIAGAENEVLSVAAGFEHAKRLRTSHAFHSPLMEPMLEEFASVVSELEFRAPVVPLAHAMDSAEYWVRHVRDAVRFADDVHALTEAGVTTFVELGPDAVLSGMAGEWASGTFVPAQRRDHDEETTLVTALARAHLRGVDVDWRAFHAGTGARAVDLPTYPFQHERFWPDTTKSTVDSWHYRIGWRPVGAGATRPDGTWLAVTPAGAEPGAPLDGMTRIEFAGDGLAARLRAHQDAVGVVSLLTEPADVATLLRALGEAEVDAPLWCVTRDAVAVEPGDRVRNPRQAGIWGLGRVAALEQPRRWGGLVDLPETVDDTVVAHFAGVLGGPEDQVAVRPSGVHGRRLTQPGALPATEWEPSGTVLITGGTGALGAQVARALAAAGAEHLVLASRSGPGAPRAARLRDELTALGADVTITSCDVADRDAVAALLAAMAPERPLTAVVHTAGVLDDGLLAALTPERFEAVYRSKVAAALVLDELTRELDLSAFVLFSSASGAVGNAGQANYAAANAVLDALAEHRRALGLPATSVAWGAWAGEGMAAGADSREAGVGALDPDLAIAALRRVVCGDAPTAVIADIDHARFVRSFAAARPSPLLSDLPRYAELVAAERDDSSVTDALRATLAELPAAAQLARVLDMIRTTTATVLGLPGPGVVRPTQAFKDIGFDSLAAIELRNALNVETGLGLPSTLVFDHPTPSVLAEHVRSRLLPPAADGAASDVDQAAIRSLLATVSLADLREVGVLEPLLQLAGRVRATQQDAATDDAIDEMALDDLVRTAMDGELR